MLTKLKSMRACGPALDWIADQESPEQAWRDCQRGDWMLWLLGKLSGEVGSESRKQLVMCCCECARLSLEHVPDGEDRPRIAIETAEAHCRGEASLDDVCKAAYAAYAYAAAAYAAYAAVADAATAAVADAAAAYADDARENTLAVCADIVRKHYPECPEF